MVFKMDFAKVMLVACGGGIAGNILFTYISAAIIRAIHNFRVKRHLIHRKKIFNKFNRRVIRIKQRFGLAGIAFITPMFLSTPVGAFIAERFYRNKRRIILYLCGATVLWGLMLYVIITMFHDFFKGWLI
jgi:hypothetical protein